MRCIDALELKRSIAAYSIIEDGKHIFDIIDEQPTIKPERKTGKWIQVDEQPYFRKHFKRFCCSVCRTEGRSKWNFCPNCGAYMKGEPSEDR